MKKAPDHLQFSSTLFSGTLSSRHLDTYCKGSGFVAAFVRLTRLFQGVRVSSIFANPRIHGRQRRLESGVLRHCHRNTLGPWLYTTALVLVVLPNVNQKNVVESSHLYPSMGRQVKRAAHVKGRKRRRRIACWVIVVVGCLIRLTAMQLSPSPILAPARRNILVGRCSPRHGFYRRPKVIVIAIGTRRCGGTINVALGKLIAG